MKNFPSKMGEISEAQSSQIMREAGCTLQTAIKAFNKANGNIKDAVAIAKDLKKMDYYAGGFSSGICVESHRKKLIKYKNGVLIEDVFYDYSNPKNLELKSMLAKNEFDAEILKGTPGDKIEIDVCDKEDEEYKVSVKREPFQGVGKKLGKSAVFPDLPDKIVMCEDCDVKFKVIAGAKKIVVFGKKGTKIQQFLQYMKNNFQFERDLLIEKNGENVNQNEYLEAIDQCLVVLDQK